VNRPALGIQMMDLAQVSSSQLKTAGLEHSEITAGVLVISTQAGLPAHDKFQKYDLITAIDGDKIENSSDLQSALYKHDIGD
ncbi:PDZ domain-containing protein, partial [Streptococcus pyogenes]